MDLLTEDLYKNIKNLNGIRNSIVHTLEVDLQKEFSISQLDKNCC